MSLLGPAAATDVRTAYQHCEQITRQQAKNFSYGIALLPGDKRRALSAVYAFARRIDDIGDGTMSPQDKLAALGEARACVMSMDPGSVAGDLVLIALRDAAARFPIPVAAFGELIDGCEADVRGVSYATFADLEYYCRCVAGSIGRLSLGVFGSSGGAEAESLADALGVALQLTNIVRDIKEDLGNGRVYLPAEDLERFGCTLTASGPDGQCVLAGQLDELIRFEVRRAKDWYAVGLRLMPMLDRRSASCTGAMAGIYLRLLDHICAAPQEALQRRMSLPMSEKALVAASSLAGMARTRRAGPRRAVPGAPWRCGMTGTSEVTSRRAIVVGGGLAGITAAIDLREAGFGVTVLEARPRLGGAASSYQRGHLTIDNGQHVILRCCDSYRELLARLGVSAQVAFQDKFDVTVLAPAKAGGAGGTGQVRQARLRRSGLPSPLHLTGSLARYGLLSPGERLRVVRAALAMRFINPADPALDSERLGDWLAARGQGERARRNLWDLFIVSALNIAGDDASLQLAATVIKTALLGANDAADIGVATVPLGELHGTAPAALLARLGAEVRMGAKVSGVSSLPGGGFSVQLAGDGTDPGAGETLAADAVVLAVPAAQAARLAAGAGVSGADSWDGLGASPIVNVHVIYDRQVTSLPYAAAVDSPVQWVFDKTKIAGLEAGQYLAVSLSAADEYVGVPAAELRERFLPELERIFPAAAKATITDCFVTRERRATFLQAPGCGVLRPGAATSVPGLVLAGSWTDTGWPDTMEGAVRSGHSAVRQLTGEPTGQPVAGAQVEVAS